MNPPPPQENKLYKLKGYKEEMTFNKMIRYHRIRHKNPSNHRLEGQKARPETMVEYD